MYSTKFTWRSQAFPVSLGTSLLLQALQRLALHWLLRAKGHERSQHHCVQEESFSEAQMKPVEAALLTTL